MIISELLKRLDSNTSLHLGDDEYPKHLDWDRLRFIAVNKHQALTLIMDEYGNEVTALKPLNLLQIEGLIELMISPKESAKIINGLVEKRREKEQVRQSNSQAKAAIEAINNIL